jgi:hypothetical protein
MLILMPNGVVYYYLSDNREFTWDAALHEVNRIERPCP